MRILLTSNAPHVPPRGGSTRSNLVWLEYLASQGHTCRVVAAAAERDTEVKRDQFRREMQEQEISGEASQDVIEQRGVTVYAVAEASRRTAVLREQIREFAPDWVLVSSEDLGHMLLREAQRSAPGRVVYLAHTPQFFPFGPAAWNADVQAAAGVRHAAAIVAIGHHTAGYIEQHLGRRPVVIHPPIYGTGPFPQYGRFDGELVTMINPSAVKGISIFCATAAQMPDVRFGALLGWGTTAADRETLSKLANVEVLGSVRRIEQVLCRTRVLLMPSLWYEGFGLIVMEAMLRGIPVVCSDAGGLVEAKQGTSFIVPVQPIEQYEHSFDEHHMPRPVLPPQEIGPWVDTVRRLLSDRELYERESRVAQQAAEAFVSPLRASALGELLESLPVPAAVAAEPGPLSAEKRALLLQRLRQRQAK